MDYETFTIRNLAYLQANFPKRQSLKYRRHPLKVMYLQEKIENMLDTIVDVYHLIVSDEFVSVSAVSFIRIVELVMTRVLKASSMIYSSDQETTSFFHTQSLKIMIDGFCSLVVEIMTQKYNALVELRAHK